MWELPTFEHVRTSVNKKQVSKNEIHAACVCNLTIGKIIWLQHLKFCNFTLWMPPCLGCQGPSSRSPPLCTPLSELQAHHCMTTKQLNWLLCSVSVIPPNKLSLRELNQKSESNCWFQIFRKFWFLVSISSWADARFATTMRSIMVRR